MASEFYDCTRCGIRCEVSATTLEKRVERGTANANWCRDCLGLGMRSQCRPWSGDVDPDTFAPIRDGKPYKPGIRTCGRVDCVYAGHIIATQDDLTIQLKKTRESGRKPCQREGCGRPIHAVGLCMMHYRRDVRAYGSHDYNRLPIGECLDAYRADARGIKVCGVFGCGAKHRSKGLCDKHYKRLYLAVGRYVVANA